MSTPEKKTYKNVNVDYVGNGNVSIRQTYPQHNIPGALTKGEANRDLLEVLASQEWDMEATFTRKVEPFVPGYYKVRTQGQAHGEVVWFFKKPVTPDLWARVNVTDAEDAE